MVARWHNFHFNANYGNWLIDFDFNGHTLNFLKICCFKDIYHLDFEL